jgi:tetraacyldisaccharide 4'-kinase
MMQEIILRAWRRKNALFCFVLVPLSWVFALLIWLRRLAYQFGMFKSHTLPVPVVVVGNINMGGSGKTPVVMWLVNALKAKGFYPGVISRGYGATVKKVRVVDVNSDVRDVGDEPLLIAKRCGCPVWVGADRAQAGLALLKAHPECNVIISDDGLQHYRLKRNVEIAVVNNDALGNRRLLPAGPLREPVKRLNEVDAIIFNGEKSIANAFEMQLVGEQFYNLADETLKTTAADFKRKSIKAFAGIGNPERFFEHLRNLGLSFAGVSFDDHYAFKPEDLANFDCDVLLMTEKDAVKCKPFAEPHHWVLPVEASIDEALLDKVLEKIAKK